MSALLEPLTSEECLAFLAADYVGRIAFGAEDGPVILPVHYRLVMPASGPLIAIRTRPGNTIDRAPTGVAFEIDGVDPVHRRGWSVLVRGELLHTAPEAELYRSDFDPEPWLDGRDSWLLIDPWAISGRRLREEEPLWVYRAGEYL
jgi:hypothetical protein